MTYTLIFGNNFISDNPSFVKCNGTTLFSLGEDINGPYLTAKLPDLSTNNVKLSIDKNHCTYCADDLVLKRNERSHVLVDNREGENVIQSRILDASTVLVSGMFAITDSILLVVTQNYIISPSGKKIMHSRISARNGSISVTGDEILPEV
jgi:hypothetical protein